MARLRTSSDRHVEQSDPCPRAGRGLARPGSTSARRRDTRQSRFVSCRARHRVPVIDRWAANGLRLSIGIQRALDTDCRPVAQRSLPERAHEHDDIATLAKCRERAHPRVPSFPCARFLQADPSSWPGRSVGARATHGRPTTALAARAGRGPRVPTGPAVPRMRSPCAPGKMPRGPPGRGRSRYRRARW